MSTPPNWVNLNVSYTPGDVVEDKVENNLLAVGAAEQGGTGIDWNLVTVDPTTGKAVVFVAGCIATETPMTNILDTAITGEVVLAGVDLTRLTPAQMRGLDRAFTSPESPHRVARTQTLGVSTEERRTTTHFAASDNPCRIDPDADIG